MTALSNRPARIEASIPKSERLTLFMLWGSPADDAAGEDLQRRAHAEGKDCFIIRLVPPKELR